MALSDQSCRKVLVLHFPSLLNYGTGMMGINTLVGLAKVIGVTDEVHLVLDRPEYLESIRAELGMDVPFKLVALPAGEDGLSGGLQRRWRRLRHLVGAGWARLFGSDCLRPLPFFSHLAPFSRYCGIIVLGGDDLSEYYAQGKRLKLLRTLRVMARQSRLVLLGQSPGPFTLEENIRAMKKMGKAYFFVREPSARQYLEEEFGLSDRVAVCGDLAFASLPRQGDAVLAEDVLHRFGLVSDGYETLVFSGDASYYETDDEVFLERWAEIAGMMASRAVEHGRRLCLLAHTFPPYGRENSIVEEVFLRLPEDIRDRVVVITEKIGPTQARLVLGNGRLTVTGRMHPAVSTFQMGKPAIALSYSRKYQGVIGESLGRADLIVDAFGHAKWQDGDVVQEVAEKLSFVDSRYEGLKAEIRKAVAVQAAKAEDALQEVAAILKEGR